jgi:lipoprotein-anchoring transpeptidase ErfK/SrfK
MRLAITLVVTSVFLSSCASYQPPSTSMRPTSTPAPTVDYAARLPGHIAVHEKTVLVDPNKHVWGAYDSSGSLVRGGLASAGADWCPDLGRRCHTHPGTYRVNSLGSPGCKSSEFPIPHGGAPMPYCMFFNRNQALHGSPYNEVVDGNISHGCVRMHIPDAEWLRYNFVNVGTQVIVKPY